MGESWHPREWVMARIEWLVAQIWIRHRNNNMTKSHKYQLWWVGAVINAYGWVTAPIWTSHSAHRVNRGPNMNKSHIFQLWWVGAVSLHAYGWAMARIWMSTCTHRMSHIMHVNMSHKHHLWCVWRSHLGWLRLVGSIKLQVFFAKEPYKRDYILQKRPIIVSIPLTVDTS